MKNQTEVEALKMLENSLVIHEKINTALMKIMQYQSELIQLESIFENVSMTVSQIKESRNINEYSVDLFSRFIKMYEDFKLLTNDLSINLNDITDIIKGNDGINAFNEMIGSLEWTKSKMFHNYDNLVVDLKNLIDLYKRPDGKNVLSIKADVFIIPNAAAYLYKYLKPLRDGMLNYMNGIAAATGFNYDKEKDQLIEVWFCNNDSSNISDHGIIVTIDNEKFNITPGSIRGLLPVSILKGHKEGDVVKVTIPDVKCHGYSNNVKADCKIINVELNLTLNQSSYRYKRFGKFEEVLTNLIGTELMEGNDNE